MIKYYKRYKTYAFHSTRCKDLRQYEACITKAYHSIEKGLSYTDYRPGFGRQNVDELVAMLESYSEIYDVSAFFYETALCTLHEYIKKNKEYGYEDKSLEKRILALKGVANESGGVIKFEPFGKDVNSFSFSDFIKSRHSMRHFSNIPADIQKITEAIKIAQHTPSACNRQGWRSRIVVDPEILKILLENQNGNRGFGQGISSLIVVTGDLRCFNSSRELCQVFVDGGMYAMNILHGLHEMGLASIPLSAALHEQQEKNVRKIAKIEDPEVLIMFIGVGNYPKHCITTRSERSLHKIDIL